MPSRREMLRTIGFTTASVLLPSATASAAAAAFRGHAALPPPWWLLAPLKPGSGLKNGWKVHDLEEIKAGASVLTIERNAQLLRIHICLHDGQPKGIAHSELFDLIVMDHGEGVRTVQPELASTLFALGDIMRENEWVDVPYPQRNGIKRMMTHSERVQAFGARNLR